MANEISLVTASGRTVTPKDDGIIYEVFSPGNGIIYGGAVTIKDSSTLHIAAGHGIVCGRKFTIDDSDIPVSLSGSGSLLGRLYIHLDLADAADPITLLVETGASLTPVVQDADVNINNGVYEINIATFDVDTTTISNLVNLDVTVAPMGDMEGATSALDGKGGYVPAPQAGDEDKVLRGDGTWGTAGDTATVRYDENTQYIQLKDSQGWFDWRKAARRAFDAIANAYAQSDFSRGRMSYSTNELTGTAVCSTGSQDSGFFFFNEPVQRAGTLHIRGNATVINSNSYFRIVKNSVLQASGTTEILLRNTSGAIVIDVPVDAGTYLGVGLTYGGSGTVGFTITFTDFYVE